MAPDDLQRIRDDLESFQTQLAGWEASCLKSVADLLDNLEAARTSWRSLREECDQAGAQRTRVEDQLVAARREIDGLRTERDVAVEERQRLATRMEEVAQSLVETEQKRATLKELSDKLNAAAEEAQQARITAETERDEARARTDETVAAQFAAATSAEKRITDLEELVTAAQAGKTAAEERLADVARERDALIAEATTVPAMREQLDEAGAKLDVLQRECEQLRHETEDQLLQVCDLRVSLNRLETQRDEARVESKRKVKKILTRIHDALDEAGAPRGDDLSYGERVRRLTQRATIDDSEPPQATA